VALYKRSATLHYMFGKVLTSRMKLISTWMNDDHQWTVFSTTGVQSFNKFD